MTDAEATVRFVPEFSPEIPFRPQLPQICEGEGMIALHPTLVCPRYPK
jgi:hypothetical protein